MHIQFPNSKKKIAGFTIVEVILVLAIAGSLMVVVFMVGSQAQKSRRDAERKSYLQSVYQALLEFNKNNGRIPACNPVAIPPACTTGSYNPGLTRSEALGFLRNYMPSETRDPLTGELYATPNSSGLCGDGTAFPNDGGTGCTGSTIWRWDAQSGPDTHARTPDVGQVFIHSAHWCYASAPDAGPPTDAIASRNEPGDHLQLDRFALLIGLEKGRYYCLDNYSEDRP